MISHSINKNNNFVAGWFIENKSICDDIIDFFEKSPNKNPGKSSKGESWEENISIKKSTDLFISKDIIKENIIIKDYYDSLSKIIKEYKSIYEYCDKDKELWGLQEGANIQRYLPGEGYYEWHCERGGLKNSARHLVYMTYLNDVDDGGETEWYYQKIKIKPQKGLTIVWPSDWPFTHRGNTSKTQTKYILTGWLNFLC